MLKLILATILSLTAATALAQSEIRAIVGEAAGQSYQAKLAVADAIRNRGSLQGVYGLHAAHVAGEPAWVWRDARRAWGESAKRDVTHGATHFGNSSDVKLGTFDGMYLTLVVGRGSDAIYFFRNQKTK